MIESDYIQQIRDRWPKGDQLLGASLLTLIQDGLREYPRSVRLLCLYGAAVQLANEDLAVDLQEALHAYERALSIDPKDVEAWEDIAYFRDVYQDDFAAAEQAFRKAIELGGSSASYTGLARVLQEQGRTSDALELLSHGCPFANDPSVCDMRQEIEERLWEP